MAKRKITNLDFWPDYPKDVANTRVSPVHNITPPNTGWQVPKEFPNLSAAKILGLDTETKDLDLLGRGPGAVRGAAHAVGISVATDDRAWYFPIRHEYSAQQSMNMPPEQVFAWLNEQLKVDRPIVGANLLYDLEVLRAEGVHAPRGKLCDVQYAEPLIDENARSYALDVLSQKYLGVGKTTSQLYQWCAQAFGGVPDGSQLGNIWRAPLTLVGPYAEQDAVAPLQILAHQQKVLAEESLTELFELECGLIPLLLEMRFRGVRVDLESAEKTAKWLREEAAKAQAKLHNVDVWSNDSVARAFDLAHVPYERTAAGNPSFTREWLESCPAPIAQEILNVRLYEKAANPFVENYILGSHHNGRIHCQFHPLRSDNYGTVSGRFSSSLPNLTNIPSRHPVIGPAIRSLFVPDHGTQRLRKSDYSQIEFRLLAHFAVGEKSDEIRQRYNQDYSTDFHQVTVDLVREVTGIELGRKPAKNLNFGLVYGMGKDKTARSLGVEYEQGIALYNAYFEALPCVKKTYDSAQRLAERRGYIKTLLGRRSRFNTFEANPYTGVNQRAGARKALNRVLQGGSADILKKAMLICWQEGLFAEHGCPHLTVHDELVWSDDGNDDRFRTIEHIMETCVKLSVPLRVETEVGPNWGETRKIARS